MVTDQIEDKWSRCVTPTEEYQATLSGAALERDAEEQEDKKLSFDSEKE